ncbi:MAG: T9SS type A sorting domain-containing protein [Aequorivita sp.]|nr:T9SS type A sorting domain-containing protein [Aequorivita sp.]
MIACAATAQTFMDNVRAEIQTKIQHLNQNDVPTRILYDRTLPLSNLVGYGTPSGFAPLVPSTPSSSSGHYFLAMEDLYRMDYLNRFTNPETLITNNQTASNIINIGIINADINKFKEDAVAIGALLVQGNDSLFYDNPNSSLSPYNTYKNVYVASTLKSKTGAKNIYFKLPSTFWKETAQYSITNLQIDFDNGNGYVTVAKNQTYYIQYTTYGIKDIVIKATFSNNSTKTLTSKLETINYADVISSETMTTLPGSCEIPIFQTFSSAPYTFQGYDEGQAYAGFGRYENHSNTTCIDKPIVVVEGYDPDDSFNNDYLFGIAQLNRNGLSTNLVGNGYDLITLNFEPRPINGKTVPGGSDYIERNAMVLVKLITYINQNKASNAEPTKVIGFSMGGVIARYALRYMELNSIPHEVDLYASVDAPHQGATVPRGAQEMVDFVDDVVPNWGENYVEFSELGENLENPAVKQMLSNHYNSATFHNTLYNNLNSMGYPQQTQRNIAVVNGSFNGSGTNDINQKFFEGKAHLLWVLIDGNIRLNFTNNSGNARVFNWRLKLLGVTVWHRERYAYTNSSVGSLENAPGGIASLDMLDEDILQLTELGFDWFVAGMSQHLDTDEFSFIPTKSALDYIGDPDLYEDINRNLVCSVNTPFDSYFSAPSFNEPHTFLSLGSSNYLFEEIEGNPQDPYPGGTGTYPYGGEYRVDPPIGITYTLLTGGGNNTLLGDPDPLNLPAAQKVTVWPNMPVGASNPTWTVWEDNDNSLDSWSSNGSTLVFHYMNKNFNSVIDFRFTITDECGNQVFTPVRFIIVEDGGRPQPIEDFVVYPVPAKDMITITNTQSKTPAMGAVLYDMFGQEKTSKNTIDNNSITLDVTSLPEGIYILRITPKDGSEVIKHISIER